MPKLLSPEERQRRAKEKAEKAAARAARKAERERKKAEREKVLAKGVCVCGRTHRHVAKYAECERKEQEIECTCPRYWHTPRENGTRWTSHSYMHGCPLAEPANAARAREYNVRNGIESASVEVGI